jgi:catechol 2,3-dioxygenase-like lactoylglutathione lyase family enzyme
MAQSPGGPTRYDVGGVLLPRPFKAGRLGHVGLYVEDMAASVRFYGDLLGFRVTDHLRGEDATADPYGTFLTYNSDHHAMVLIGAAVARARGDRYARGITVNQISFQVATLREVIDTHEMLVREGAPVWRVGRDVPGSNWAVYFTDPDGHTVELFYGMEQIGWDRRSKPLAAFGRYRSSAPPALPQLAELDEIRAVAADGADTDGGHQWDDRRPAAYDVGGVLLPRPFKVVNSGPISLFVADLGESVRFYTDRMGLAVTEEISYAGQRVVFLRAGAEHHTITLLPLALRSELGLAERTTLMAYGLQVATYRQLRDAADFLAGHGYPVTAVPPELHAGIDYAVHVTDPEGHCVQLYHELESVGSAGRPLTATERRRAGGDWPALLEPGRPAAPNLTYQGPLG